VDQNRTAASERRFATTNHERLLQWLETRLPGAWSPLRLAGAHPFGRFSFALDYVLIDDRCGNVRLRIELESLTVMQ
jgi:hypothetical protein